MTAGISVKQRYPHVRTTVVVVSSLDPRKFSTARETVKTSPTSTAVTFSVASNDPLKGAKASRKETTAATGVSAAPETSQTADSEREAPPELALASNLTSPQRPTVCMYEREMC